jgi:cell division protein FtsL
MAASTAAAAPLEMPDVAVERLVSRPIRRTRPRSRVTGGVLWIVLVAILLAGVVALNVAVLRLNVQYDKLGRTKVSLVAQNSALSSQLSSSAATGRIQLLARTQLGLVPAPADRTTYIVLDR